MAALPKRVAGLPAVLRPRMLTFELDLRNGRTRPFRIRWAMPLWAIEQILTFALRMAPLAAPLAAAAAERVAPSRAPKVRRAMEKLGARRGATPWLDTLRAMIDAPEDLLALPDGLPYVSVETDDVRLVIGRW